MTYHISDRRRRELALPAELLHRAVYAAMLPADADKFDAETRKNNSETLDAIRHAAREPMEGIDAKTADRLMRTVCRDGRTLLRPYEDHALPKVILMLLLWLQDLLARDVLHLAAGSPMAEALDSVIDALEKFPDILDGVDRSARRAATQFRGQVERMGYYVQRGAP